MAAGAFHTAGPRAVAGAVLTPFVSVIDPFPDAPPPMARVIEIQ